MKKCIIVGTGGFAAEITDYIHENNKYSSEKTEIFGYLDISENNYVKYGFAAKFLGCEDSFVFTDEYEIYVAVGNDKVRSALIEKLKSKNANLPNFIHHSVRISPSAEIGRGNIFCPNVIIGPASSIGDLNIINYYTSIAHDCYVGDGNIFSPSIQVTGYCQIGNNNFFGSMSGVTPAIKIGNNNKIQAGIIVNKNIDDNSIVFTTTQIKNMVIYK